MSTELNVTNGIKANLNCPTNSTITVENVNSNNEECDNEKALETFINKCVGNKSCIITEEELDCPGKIDVKYYCVNSDGDKVSKSTIDASIEKEEGGDFNIDATISNSSDIGDVTNNNNSSEILEITSETSHNKIDEAFVSSANKESSDKKEKSFYGKCKSAMLSFICVIFIGIVLFYGWKLFTKYKKGIPLLEIDTTIASTLSSTFSATSPMIESDISATSAPAVTTSSVPITTETTINL